MPAKPQSYNKQTARVNLRQVPKVSKHKAYNFDIFRVLAADDRLEKHKIQPAVKIYLLVDF